jgi:plasmid stability protein
MEPNDSQIRERTAMNYTLKNIPEEIYEKIKLRAQTRRRSINSEIIAILGEVVNPRCVSVEEFLARADEIRARTKGFVTDEFLRKAKRDGLP